MRPRWRLVALGSGILSATLALATPAAAASFAGRVTDAHGVGVAGAFVSVSHGDPAHTTSVYSGDDGAYRTPELAAPEAYQVRVRRIGWREHERQAQLPAGPVTSRLDVVLERETDAASVASQLPANRWFGLVLSRIEDPVQREELVRQCTYCHQQGNWSTRMLRPAEQWEKVLGLMARLGGGVSPELRSRIPVVFSAAYDPATAVPALTARMHEADFAPAPSARAGRAVIEEWALGGNASMQHDLTVHPDGRIYSVDMMQDKLFRLETGAAGAKREAFDIPQGDLPLGGVFASNGPAGVPNSNAHVGPHSLQVAPDGAIWITLALGNQIARFDPASEQWSIHPLAEGYYPHTLRFDHGGRVWYTVAASNHVGVLDPKTGDHRWIRLPSRTWGEAFAMRALPFFLWLNRQVDLSDYAAGAEGVGAPVPYGIDVAPDGGIWISQLNAHRIGRIDPVTFDVEVIDTPFTGPRRLRFDSQGQLWIPGFSAGLVARFDPRARAFRSWELPSEPRGSDVPYALNVDRTSDVVWICGTNSDSLYRFDPKLEEFTVYPLPTRVTYTREIDFDLRGRVWTSNSNLPTWQIEGLLPRVLRLDPEGLAGERVELAGR